MGDTAGEDAAGAATATDATRKAGRGLLGIGQAAQELGVSVRSLRYYEEVGLLTPSGRTSGGNRLFSDEDLARVRRIRELQALLGFNLDEIRAVLKSEDRLAQVRADYHAAADDDDRARLLLEAQAVFQRLRGEVEEKIGRLTTYRNEIDERLARTERILGESIARTS